MSRSPSASPVPLRADAERNRRALLRAAREVFAEEGIDATVAAIAKRAGVAKGTFFRHFAGKDVLVSELLSDLLAQLAEVAEQIDAEHPPGWGALCMMVEQFNAIIAKQVGVMTAAEGRTPFDPEKTGRAVERLRANVSTVLARAQEVGEVRADVTETDVQMITMAITTATASLQSAHPGLGRRHLRIVLDGLRATAPSDLGTPPITPAEIRKARGSPDAIR